VGCGWLANNPFARLEGTEKPHRQPVPIRVVEGPELNRLLDHADPHYRPLLEFLAFTGLRIGEALGLCWCDVDLEAGIVRLRHQLARHRTLETLKTPAARRDVILADPIIHALRKCWLASPHPAPSDVVWLNQVGRPINTAESATPSG
jgi:integrase